MSARVRLGTSLHSTLSDVHLIIRLVLTQLTLVFAQSLPRDDHEDNNNKYTLDDVTQCDHLYHTSCIAVCMSV